MLQIRLPAGYIVFRLLVHGVIIDYFLESVVGDDWRADWCPFVDPLAASVWHTDAAMRSVERAKDAERPPIVTMDGVIFVKIADPLDVWHVVTGTVGIWPAHCLGTDFTIDFKFTDNGRRFWCASAHWEGPNLLVAFIGIEHVVGQIDEDPFVVSRDIDNLVRFGGDSECFGDWLSSVKTGHDVFGGLSVAAYLDTVMACCENAFAAVKVFGVDFVLGGGSMRISQCIDPRGDLAAVDFESGFGVALLHGVNPTDNG